MKIKWYGTASILLEHDGSRLLFDPFIPINKKAYKPPIEELAAIENIFITHGHYDHVSDVPAIFKKGNGKQNIYCTATPRATLVSKGVDENCIKIINPQDVLNIGSFTIRVLKGKHIIFDTWQILKTLFNFRIFTNWKNLRHILKEHKHYDEAGETVVYEISAAGKQILLLGSLNLDDNTEYPKDADLLVLPFQGRSDINKYAMNFIGRLQPKKILLDHFDDTFPPISATVNPRVFIKVMKQKYPDVSVIYTQPGAEWIEVKF
uniref:Metallo-beta-lactamase domain-containing protein n=1 Tax=uncultured bacterium contig00056 TaxID=1181540 RepID=A0A806KCE9_9BACT|nr:hypothetical protein [uncultured bacterium contig00056]